MNSVTNTGKKLKRVRLTDKWLIFRSNIFYILWENLLLFCKKN